MPGTAKFLGKSPRVIMTNQESVYAKQSNTLDKKSVIKLNQSVLFSNEIIHLHYFLLV